MITLELERGRIRLRTPRPLTGINHKVPGAFFSEGRRGLGGPHWSLPLSLPVCRRLREEYGSELEIGPTLWAWARDEQMKSRAMAALASARSAKLLRVPEIAPRLAKAMKSRKYQRVGARFVAEATTNGAGCLVADQPGLGKTLEAIGGVVESGVSGPYLVVAPKTSVEPVWAREIPRWLDGQVIVTLPDGDRQRNLVVTKERQRRNAVLDALASSPDLDRTWVIVHPEAVRTQVWWVCGVCGQETRRKAGKVELKCKDEKGRPVTHSADLRQRDRVEHEYPQLFGRQWGAILCDEGDRALLRLSGTPTQTRQGMETIALRPDGLRVAMTGTPTRGRPHLLWGILNWLDPKAFPSFWNWVALYWELTSNGYSAHVIGELRDEEGLWDSLDRYVLRRTKAEVAPDMPAKNYVGTEAIPGDFSSPIAVWLPMDKVQAKAYNDMLTTSAADLEDGSRVEAIGILAELMRLKQFAGASGTTTTETRMKECKNDPDPAQGCPVEKHSHPHTFQQFHPALPSNKFEYLVQLLYELGYPDDPQTKVVVVSQFTEMLNLFAAELPARMQAMSAHPRTPIKSMMMPTLLTGEQTGRRRTEAIAAMNEPVGSGKHLMLIQTKTGGVAITLDEADVMVFLDETWVPDDQEQAEDRIHRVSRPRPVWYHYLKSLDTIDLGIALTNAERDDNSKRLLDGRRGVEYARAVLRRTREMSGGMDPRPGGNASRRGGGVLDGSPGGARETRTLDKHSGSRDSNAKTSRRDRSEKDSGRTLAPETAVGYKGNGKSPNPQRRANAMAKQMSDEQILAYKDKATTATQERYADWLIEKLEIEFTGSAKEVTAKEAAFREAVRLATALRSIFQASPENQSEREEAKSAKAEAQAEKAKGKAKGKAKAAEEEAEEAVEDEAPAKPAKKAAKATKAAKPAPKDEEDDDDTAVAAPAKKSAPKKAARTGAAAPF